MNGEVQTADYVALLEAVKAEIAGSRVRAARAVNAELIGMYRRIGTLILERQAEQGWGTRVIERLAADLRASFPNARGLGRRNLHYMRAFAEAWPEEVQQAAAQLPWSHIMVLLDRLDDQPLPTHIALVLFAPLAHGWKKTCTRTVLMTSLLPLTTSTRAGESTGGAGRGR